MQFNSITIRLANLYSLRPRILVATTFFICLRTQGASIYYSVLDSLYLSPSVRNLNVVFLSVNIYVPGCTPLHASLDSTTLPPRLSLALPLHALLVEEIMLKKTQGHMQAVSGRCMQRHAQMELRRAQAFRVCAIRAWQLATKFYEDVDSMQQLANKKCIGCPLTIKICICMREGQKKKCVCMMWLHASCVLLVKRMHARRKCMYERNCPFNGT